VLVKDDDSRKIYTEIEKCRSESSKTILPLVYAQLRSLAKGKLALEPPGATLSGTALVHEAYLRVAGSTEKKWDGIGHFYAAVAESMRRILIDKARRRKAVKHGGNLKRDVFDSIAVPVEAESDEIFAVHDSLDKLASEYPRKAEVVKMKCFVGLTFDEIANVLAVSISTVERDWAFARAWLKVEIGNS